MLNEYNDFADLLVEDVLSKLEGSNEYFDRFQSVNKPSREIILGSLSDEDVTNTRSKSSIRNNSMSVKFLLDEFKDSIKIIPKFSIFYKVYPTFEEQTKYIQSLDEESDTYKFAPIWKKEKFDEGSISLNLDNNEVELDLTDLIKKVNQDKSIFLANKNDRIKCDDEEIFLNEIKSSKSEKNPKFDWKCKVFLKSSPLYQNGQLLNLIEVGMVNLTEKNDLYETFLFDCNFDIDLEENHLRSFFYSYEENDKLKSYESDLRTLNCHANYREDENKIETTHFSKYEESKREPKTNIGNFELTFESLMSDSCIETLETLYNLMDSFESDCILDEDNKDDFENFKNSKESFLNGIKCLKEEDENALRAFKLMNESFYENSKKYNTWRIFQIVFIVSLIPEIIHKDHDRNFCDLLHVMTGGGKSESYFGVVIFAAFYDRLIGKSFGVTAWTKFPLRMLSIQQLQRISNIFIWAEEIRLREDIPGKPFTVAYWVGNKNSDFPKDNLEIIDEINDSDAVKGKIIEKCPICGGDVFLTVDEERQLVMHECSSCEKQFGLFFTDYEIYRVLPTFIISTVDKLSAISHQYRAKNIFGGKLDICSQDDSFIPRNGECLLKPERCEGENIEKNPGFNTGPSIIIQDEMHLVKEGFGTINSHFESFLEALSMEFSGEKLKYIAMSATVNGASKQIKELYNKNTRIFPPSLKNRLNEDFFFKEKKEDGKRVYSRQIIGLKPNFVDNNTAIILSLKYVSQFIKSVEDDEDFAKKHGFKNLDEIIKRFKSILTYHLKVSDVHNTKNFINRRINDSKEDLYKIDTLTLTGDNSLDSIKEIIGTVEDFAGESENKLQVTSSTNIVSHGVDIDDWNLMFFQGIPRSTSEYIQALSRVGRKYHGVVFLWFYPNRIRDISYYQNFNEYHGILQYKVENVPIARWTKLGFKQTFTSIFNASILMYLSDVLEKPISDLNDLRKVLSDETNRHLLIDFIKKAYIVDSDEDGAKYFKDNIEKEVDERIEHIKNYEGDETFLSAVLADCPNRYFKTQSGMRGIQDTVNVKRNLPLALRK